MSEQSPNRIELHDFAEQLGLTPAQVRDELAGGRLAFDVDDAGVVFTDRFAALDWIQRRVAAISMFGQNGVGFPLFPADWSNIEHIPGPTFQGMASEVAQAAKQALDTMQEAEKHG